MDFKRIFAVIFWMSEITLARNVVCPKGEITARGITTKKPRTQIELVDSSITPPLPAVPDEWNINAAAGKRKDPIYLSCGYKNGKMIVFKLPLEKEICMTQKYNKDLFVVCEKK